MSDFPVMEYKPMDGEEQIELTPHEGELEFWDKIMRSTRQPMQRRMKAAELGAQYKYAPISEAQLVRSTLLTEQAPVKRTAREIADS
jgi:hypothetical protein